MKGGEKDIEAMRWAFQSGVNIVATIHAEYLQQVEEKLGTSLFRQFDIYVEIKKRGSYQCYFGELEHCS